MSDEKTLVVEVKRLNKSFIINDIVTGSPVQLSQEKIPEWMLRKAVKYDVYLMKKIYKDGKIFWRQVEKEHYKNALATGVNIPTKRANRKKNLFN